ncbi:MAG TPA: SRPBCC family protein [Ktedonobacteraceae bacterium]|nr:SRPBCC family protein [Ktedonobacteraceae bacterium]
MSEHHVSAEVHAPLQQVYNLFTHFNDFPKFMRFVKEVTYYDNQRSHWVAEVGGNQEWDAVNEDWVPLQQIGWRSVNGLENSGKVKFTPLGNERTGVDVYISYVPPSGFLGALADKFAFENHFDAILQADMNRFAAMVEKAPADALDPMQSHYLFHDESAYGHGTTTDRQQEAMAHDPMMQPQALQQRDRVLQQQEEQAYQFEQNKRSGDERVAREQRQAADQQRSDLARQAELDREMADQRQLEQSVDTGEVNPHPVYDTLGGRNAAAYRTPFGDHDARNERFPGHSEDPMVSRTPQTEGREGAITPVADIAMDSPWRNAIRGGSLEPEPDQETPENAQENPSLPDRPETE